VAGSFRLSLADGRDWVSPGKFNGRPSVFLFWDTACAPCLAELAALPRLQAAFPEAVFVIVSLSPREDARRMLAKYRPPPEVLRAQGPLDPRGLLATFGNRNGALPFSASFDPDGKLCAAAPGALTPHGLASIASRCSGR
jgi:hypothetical protein